MHSILKHGDFGPGTCANLNGAMVDLIANGQQTLCVAVLWAIATSPARLKTNLFHMIWIDRTYDMVAVQEVQKYGCKSGCDFGPVDPVKYAEAFGATGLMIRTADEIGPVLKKAFDTPGRDHRHSGRLQ
jgi:acetolactate synthase-1/2/3 large subunit